jgi:uncharacterized coiled-coil DUF342 family protein
MERYRDQMRVSRDEARKASADVREQLAEMTAERDVALADVRLQLTAKSVIIAERDAAERERTESRAEVVKLQAERDAVSEQLARCREAADMFEQENAELQDTVRQLRAKQVHDDLPGLLKVIQLAAEQARELI